MNHPQENAQKEYTPVPLTPKVVLYPLIWGVFAVLMSVVTVLMPSLAIVTVAFGSLSFALMKLYAPSVIYERLLPVVFTVAALLITDSLTLTALLLGVFLPGGYMMAWIIGARKKFNYAVASQFLVYALYTVAVFVILLGEYGDFKLDNIIEPFAAAVKDIAGQIYDVLSSPVDVAEITGVAQQDQLAESTFYLFGINSTKSNFVYDTYMLVIQTIPTIVAVFFLAISALSYWMAKGILRRKKNLDPEAVKFFSNFDTFRVSTVGGIIYVLLSLLALFITSNNGMVVISTLSAVMTVVFCYEGAALIGFFMKMHGCGRFVRGLVYALLFIFCMIPAVSNILSLLGLFDCFWHLRKFIRPSARYM